jgi:hypothetical protein
MKRILIILLIVALLIGGAYLLWRLFGQGENILTPPPPPPSSSVTTDSSLVFSEPVQSYWISATNHTLYAVTPEGKVFSVNLADKTKKALYSLSLTDLHSVTPSPSTSTPQALFLHSYPSREAMHYLDLTNGSWKELPEGTTAAAWSPDGNQIAFLVEGGISSSLNVLTVATNRVEKITSLHQFDLDLAWLIPQEIYLTQKPSALIPSSAWSINLKTKAWKTMVAEERGLTVQWSADLHSGIQFTSALGPAGLTLISPDYKKIGAFQIATLPSKCLIVGSFYYCAVPDQFPSGASLPDDYFKRKIYTTDALYVWNSASGKAAEVIQPTFSIDAEQLSVDGGQLYFVNRYDNKIYSLPLPALR